MIREISKAEITTVSGAGEEADVVVTATRAQVDAARWAYQRALNDVVGVGSVATYGTGYFSPIVGVGIFIAETYSGATQQVIETLAEAYYLDDAADGVYDGVSDSDRNAPYGMYPSIQPL